MPELPDIEAYIAALRVRILEEPITHVTVLNPFVLRSVDPPIESIENARVTDLSRLGKRIALHLDNDTFVVIHLMVAGRLRWLEPGKKPPSRLSLLSLRFEPGTLVLTEAGSKRQASVHVVGSAAALAQHDPGGIEPLACSVDEFATALRRENHTVKKALCSPRIVAGIGNAFSDEILHAARLSPLKLTGRLSDDELSRLHAAVREVLGGWVEELSARYVKKFPGAGEVTAFRKEFCAHGKFEQACQACGGSIARIRYADNETNYCPGCQTGGKLLADRSMSRLLKRDWGKESAT